MTNYRKTARKVRPELRKPRTIVGPRGPHQFKVKELRKLPWWCDPVVLRALADRKVR
jgi:hypothetical protein